MTEVTYQGVTHTCGDPHCHVTGFVDTLGGPDNYGPIEPQPPTLRLITEQDK